MTQANIAIQDLRESAETHRKLANEHLEKARQYTRHSENEKELGEKVNRLVEEYERAADLLQEALGQEQEQKTKGHGV